MNFEVLPKCNDEREQLTSDEFDQAVKLMENGKTPGQDASEVRRMTTKVVNTLNGANTLMVSAITGRTVREEVVWEVRSSLIW